jgi:glutathione synthase/RimK-type ligase-like ATP-grasp enzyme
MTTPQKIAIVTCRAWPEVSSSDALLARELESRGHDVRAVPWNDAPVEDVASADIVVLRSNWDFHYELAAFEDWLDAVEASGVVLQNSAELVRQHNHKSYLQRFADIGVRTPATLVIEEFDAGRIEQWMGERGFESVVLKPAWGASGHDVERATAADLRTAQANWEAQSDRRDMVVQEFVSQIRFGEFALVFFGGQFSHALHRSPAAGDFRVNSQYLGSMTLAASVDPAAISLAARVLASLPEQPTYARIDVVGAGREVTLMEVELNEPALGLDLAPGSADRFADALVGR